MSPSCIRMSKSLLFIPKVLFIIISVTILYIPGSTSKVKKINLHLHSIFRLLTWPKNTIARTQLKHYGKHLALLLNCRPFMILILLLTWPLFGYECIRSCETKRFEPGKSEFVWISLPVPLTSMSKTSRITSKPGQVVIWTWRTRQWSELWCGGLLSL